MLKLSWMDNWVKAHQKRWNQLIQLNFRLRASFIQVLHSTAPLTPQFVWSRSDLSSRFCLLSGVPMVLSVVHNGFSRLSPRHSSSTNFIVTKIDR